MPVRIAVPVAFIVAAALASSCSRGREEEVAAPHPAPKVAANVPQADTAPQNASVPPSPRDAINDSIISSRVKAGILADPAMAGADVSVNTDHGVVSLTGIIRSQEQAAIASAHAQRPDGVLRVDNQLAVNFR